MADPTNPIPSANSPHIDLMIDRVAKLSLQPGDLIIVRDEADMDTFLTMTRE